MRKDIILPGLALGGGAAGFFLRRWQMASAYQPETELFTPNAPATLVLLALFALLALAFLLLIRGGPQGDSPDYLDAFRCPETGYMTVMTAAWILLCAAGGFGMQGGFRGLRQWRAEPALYQFSYPAAQLLAGALCILAGFGVLYMGRMAYRGELEDTSCRLASFPALAGLIWLFSIHLEHGTEPVLMKYGFSLFAALLLTLAHYYAAGFLFKRPHRRRALFCSLMGISLAVTALADGPGLFTAAAALGFALSALVQARALLRNTFGPPWPKRLMSERMPPAEEGNTDDA